MDISKILADFRKSSGKSQKEFAEELGLPQTTWAGYELGKSEPKLGTLLKLAEMNFIIPELTNGSAKSVLEKTSKETGLPEEEIVRQRFEQVKGLPLDTTEDDLPPPVYTKSDAPSTEFEAKRKANTTAAITMLENAAKSIEAAVRLLKENVGE